MIGRFIIKILKHQNAGIIKNVKMIDFEVPFFYNYVLEIYVDVFWQN